ncbi:MAG: dicarboxylate/amino acid:cation symporter [Spirochaetaceae bacterium]|nr:MAG: dicarboxylate/amino acid:cation symporter [Spirochaetaceae bacterium]
MRIWFRYLLGASIGVALGLFLPLAAGDTAALLMSLTGLVLSLGRILLFPLLFFAVIIAIDELHSDGTLLKTGGATLFWTILTTVTATVGGLLAIVLLSPQRIPPMVQEGRPSAAPSILMELQRGLPPNMFRIFVLDNSALAGILLIGLLVGVNLRFDRGVTSPVTLVADSANRIFYRLNSMLVEVLGLLLVIPSAAVVVQMREVTELQLFGQFLLVVLVAAIFIAVILYPAVIFLLDRRGARPLKWLASMGAPALAALTTGDNYFALGTMVRTGKEDMDIHRRIGGTVIPFVALYGRAGSAMVSMAGFLLVIRSYTALDIGVQDLVLLALAAVLYSFLLARTPAGGVLLMLSFLATRYGRGMEESYLILLPVMPALERIGAVLDIMTVGFITRLVGGPRPAPGSAHKAAYP